MSIETESGRVDVSDTVRAGIALDHGALAAFYWRFVRGPAKERQRREATDVFPLDSQHLLLTARLISEGRLVFPNHADALGIFFEGLATEIVSPQDVNLFHDALSRLSTDPRVPADLQMLSRVERSRLKAGDAGSACVVRPPDRRNQAGAKASGSPGSDSRSQRSATPADDVVQVKLQLE
jgi:hypothetical protein